MKTCDRCSETSNFDGPMCFWCKQEVNRTPDSYYDGEEEPVIWGVFRTPAFKGERGCLDIPIRTFDTKEEAERVARTGIQFGDSRYIVLEVTREMDSSYFEDTNE